MVTFQEENDLTVGRGKNLYSLEEATKPPEQVVKIENLYLNINIPSETENPNTPSYLSRRGFSQAKFVKEDVIANELKKILLAMQDSLDDEQYFDQLKIAFFNSFSKIEERKEKREVYFSDLCVMIIQSVRNISTKILTKTSFDVLMSAIDCLSKSLNREQIGELRTIFRKAKLNILPKLKTVEPNSIEEKIKALFS